MAVIIGGSGGSGTRVVARVIKKLGISMSFDTNNSEDDLTFTLLLKRPYWLSENIENGEKICKYVRILKKIHQRKRLDTKSLLNIIDAAVDVAVRGRNRRSKGDPFWAAKRLLKILVHVTNNCETHQSLGLKEPHTMLLYKQISKVLKNPIFIHVVRNGLDMAYSGNQQMMNNFGSMFGLDVDPYSSSPENALKFWILSNKYAIRQLQEEKDEKYLIVKFEEVCKRPYALVNEIANFLPIDCPIQKRTAAKEIPQVPETIGRYKQRNYHKLLNKYENYLNSFGYFV